MTGTGASMREVLRSAAGVATNVTITFASLVSAESSLKRAGYSASEAQGLRPVDWAVGGVWVLADPASAAQLTLISTGRAVLASHGSEEPMSDDGVVASATWVGDDQIEVVFARQGQIVERAEFPPPSADDLPPSIRAAWTAAGVTGGAFRDAVEVAARLASVDLDAPPGPPRPYDYRRVEFAVPYGLEDLQGHWFRHRLVKAVGEADPEARRRMTRTLADQVLVALGADDVFQAETWRDLVVGALPDDESRAVRSALTEASSAALADRDAVSDRFLVDPQASNKREMAAANRWYWTCCTVHYALADDSELALLGVVAMQRLAQLHPDNWEGHFGQEDAVIAALREV